MPHTQGPWIAAQPGDYDEDGISVSARNNRGMLYTIASVRYMGTAPSMGAEQNARLIAAAPEMLEALKLAYKWLRNIQKAPGNTNLLIDTQPFEDKAGLEWFNRAIAKAEGRSI